MDGYQSSRDCCCTRCRTRGVMGPVILITLGLLFLVDQFTRFSFGETWPILLIIVGLVKVLGSTAGTEGHSNVVEAPGSTPPPPPATPESPRQEQVNHV
jgi:hypothetical protein